MFRWQRGPGVSLQAIIKAGGHSDDLVKKISKEAFALCANNLLSAVERLKQLPSVKLASATAVLAAFDDRAPHYSGEFIMVLQLTQTHREATAYLDACKAAHAYLQKEDSPFKKMDELEMACYSVGTSPAFLAKHFPAVTASSGYHSMEDILLQLPRCPRSPTAYKGGGGRTIRAQPMRRPYKLPTLGAADDESADEELAYGESSDEDERPFEAGPSKRAEPADDAPADEDKQKMKADPDERAKPADEDPPEEDKENVPAAPNKRAKLEA